MTTDTPRTDAVAHYCRVGIPLTGIDDNDIMSVYVPIIYAREQEGELNALKAEVEELNRLMVGWKQRATMSETSLEAEKVEIERLRANLRRAIAISEIFTSSVALYCMSLKTTPEYAEIKALKGDGK